MKTKANKMFNFLEGVTKAFEVIIAFFLLIVVAIKVTELVMDLSGFQIVFINMGFDEILSTSISLVIGVELVKMLYKHTPETVIDVLLFAIARQMVIYHEGSIDMLVGILAMAGLFAAKRFLISEDFNKYKFKVNLLTRKKQRKEEDDDPANHSG